MCIFEIQLKERMCEWHSRTSKELVISDQISGGGGVVELLYRQIALIIEAVSDLCVFAFALRSLSLSRFLSPSLLSNLVETDRSQMYACK